MTGPEQPAKAEATTAPPLPEGYPDPDVIDWVRTEEIEFLGLHIRMTITPGANIVQLWELDDGRPVGWMGNAFRVHADTPCLRVSNKYRHVLPRVPQQDALAKRAATFWKS